MAKLRPRYLSQQLYAVNATKHSRNNDFDPMEGHVPRSTSIGEMLPFLRRPVRMRNAPELKTLEDIEARGRRCSPPEC